MQRKRRYGEPSAENGILLREVDEHGEVVRYYRYKFKSAPLGRWTVDTILNSGGSLVGRAIIHTEPRKATIRLFGVGVVFGKGPEEESYREEPFDLRFSVDARTAMVEIEVLAPGRLPDSGRSDGEFGTRAASGTGRRWRSLERVRSRTITTRWTG